MSLGSERDYQRGSYMYSLVVSRNPSGNLIFAFYQNMACYMFLESFCQGHFNNILYFEFGEKFHEFSLIEAFKSAYFI
jgi:hypothetical protein